MVTSGAAEPFCCLAWQAWHNTLQDEGAHVASFVLRVSRCSGLKPETEPESHASREMLEQSDGFPFDDIVVAIGSGGTAAGIALAVHLAKLPAKVSNCTFQQHLQKRRPRRTQSAQWNDGTG